MRIIPVLIALALCVFAAYAEQEQEPAPPTEPVAVIEEDTPIGDSVKEKEYDFMSADKLDLNQDHFIEKEEFLAWLHDMPILVEHYKPAELVELGEITFRMMDLNKNGKMGQQEYNELYKVFAGLGGRSQLSKASAAEDRIFDL